jgi:hypothetical protein
MRRRLEYPVRHIMLISNHSRCFNVIFNVLIYQKGYVKVTFIFTIVTIVLIKEMHVYFLILYIILSPEVLFSMRLLAIV